MRPRFSHGGDFIHRSWCKFGYGLYGLGSTTADLDMDGGCFKCHDLEQFRRMGRLTIGSDTLTVDLSSYAVSGAELADTC